MPAIGVEKGGHQRHAIAEGFVECAGFGEGRIPQVRPDGIKQGVPGFVRDGVGTGAGESCFGACWRIGSDVMASGSFGMKLIMVAGNA